MACTTHTLSYPEERYSHAYCYDVYDTNTEKYLPQSTVQAIVSKLNLIYVPTFYEGEFISWEHCMSFVGKTDLGGEHGEGIVIKNQTMLNNPNTRQPFYIKIVAEKFQEAHTHKEARVVDPATMKKRGEVQKLAETIVTEARVGGGNRNCGFGEEVLYDDENFIKTYDDEFDKTYATYEFKVPDRWKNDFDKILNSKMSDISNEYIEYLKNFYPKLASKGIIGKLFS